MVKLGVVNSIYGDFMGGDGVEMHVQSSPDWNLLRDFFCAGSGACMILYI